MHGQQNIKKKKNRIHIEDVSGQRAEESSLIEHR